MKTFEIWTGSQWSAVTLRADGEIVYISNGSKVGNGMRITRVSDDINHPPVAVDILIEDTING